MLRELAVPTGKGVYAMLADKLVCFQDSSGGLYACTMECALRLCCRGDRLPDSYDMQTSCRSEMRSPVSWWQKPATSSVWLCPC